MTSSSAVIYRQYETIDNSADAAGKQWLHALWHIYQFLFSDNNAIDNGRWILKASSPSAANWSSASNIVDNSWFVAEAALGRYKWQVKFQATNATVLDESPSNARTLVCCLSPAGGWVSKGGANGGFSGTSVPSSGNLALGGGIIGGINGEVIFIGDRDTLVLGIATNSKLSFNAGGYVGLYDVMTDNIPYPLCLLGCWAGAGYSKGFDRVVGGSFSAAPTASYVLDNTGTGVTCACYTSGWLDTAHQPDVWTSRYHFRPMELVISTSPLGFLRHVWGVGGLGSKSRLDYRQKLVLHNGDPDHGVAIKHNCTYPPTS